MHENLPARLREASTHALMDASRKMVLEAADEIERLRGYRDEAEADAAVARMLVDRLRLAPDERDAINAMACYFDTKGSIQMQAWGSLLRVILLRNDRLGHQ